MTSKKENSHQQHAQKIPQKIQGTMAILEAETFQKYLGSNKYEVNVSTCSGFFVERDQITTSFHVLEGAMSITAKHVDTGAAYTIEGITAFDEKNDLTVLKVSEEEIPFPLGNSETVKKKRAFVPSATTGTRKTTQRL